MNKDVKKWILLFAFMILGAVLLTSAVAAGQWITEKGLALAAVIGWASRYIVGGLGILSLAAVVGIWRSRSFLDRVLGWVGWA